MSWQPIPKEELCNLMDSAWDRMTPTQRNLWQAIHIPPEKWILHPWGDLGGGFWVVGLIGRTVIWYNDIEEGFNRSDYTVYGTIDTYWCNQDSLEVAINSVLQLATTGGNDGRFGPPMPPVP